MTDPGREDPRVTETEASVPTPAEPKDDGRVIVDMNVEGFSWYRKNRQKTQKNDPDQPTKAELRAMIRAAYKAYLPYFLIVVGVFLLVFLIGYLYLM